MRGKSKYFVKEDLSIVFILVFDGIVWSCFFHTVFRIEIYVRMGTQQLYTFYSALLTCHHKIVLFVSTNMCKVNVSAFFDKSVKDRFDLFGFVFYQLSEQ